MYPSFVTAILVFATRPCFSITCTLVLNFSFTQLFAHIFMVMKQCYVDHLDIPHFLDQCFLQSCSVCNVYLTLTTKVNNIAATCNAYFVSLCWSVMVSLVKFISSSYNSYFVLLITL